MKDLKTVKTPEEFVNWATSAKSNSRVAYFRGFLLKERLTNHTTRKEGPNAAPHFKLATKAWEFYNLGIVKLFQERVSDDDYIYIAVKA